MSATGATVSVYVCCTFSALPHGVEIENDDAAKAGDEGETPRKERRPWSMEPNCGVAVVALARPLSSALMSGIIVDFRPGILAFIQSMKTMI